jgi:hypothetical protein
MYSDGIRASHVELGKVAIERGPFLRFSSRGLAHSPCFEMNLAGLR